MKLLYTYIQNYLELIFLQQLFTMILNLIILKLLKRNPKLLLKCILTSFILSVAYMYIGLAITIINWIFLIIINLKNQKKLSISLTSASLSLMIFILSDHITTIFLDPVFISNKLCLNTRLQLFIHVALSILIMFLLGITSIYFNNKILKHLRLNKYIYWVSSIISTVTFFIYYIDIFIERYIVKSRINEKTNGFFFMIYAIMATIVFIIALYTIKKDSENKYREIEFKLMEEYTIKLEENYSEMRKFKHDYQNILMSLEGYIEDKNINKLRIYFNDYIKPTSSIIAENSFKLSQLSNLKQKEFKSIIASKLIYSQELGINTSFEALEIIDYINMNPIKLVRAIGILIDNAIEEVQKDINYGYIKVGIIDKNESILIIVSNKCIDEVPELYKIQEIGFSTKGEGRGIGLNTLKEIINSSDNVTLETCVEKDVFNQIIEIRK
ncbi:sensor histidine kinase [Paraclostridium dentum]|uniref:sensor histidine kinase n=2 Tax=Paraclostridium TaxID=1849822 RepID=UPI003B00AF09